MSNSVFSRRRFQLAALGWAIFIFVLSSIPGNDLPKVGIVNFDKLAHLGVYACFSFLIVLAFRHQERYPLLSRAALISALVAGSLYGASDEFHQLFVPGRTCDFWDWTADTLGAAMGVAMMVVLDRRARKPSGDGV